MPVKINILYLNTEVKIIMSLDKLSIVILAFFLPSSIPDLNAQGLIIDPLSPEVYAWYIGYKEEYFQLEKSFHFTDSEEDLSKLSTKNSEEINSLTNSIGLKSTPAELWNSKIY